MKTMYVKFVDKPGAKAKGACEYSLRVQKAVQLKCFYQ